MADCSRKQMPSGKLVPIPCTSPYRIPGNELLFHNLLCYNIKSAQLDKTAVMFKKSSLISLAIIFSTPAIAQQSAHVHGFASINLAIDDEELQIEFVSPAESIVGFEYEPSNASERKAVADAIALLRNPTNLFVLPASAGCELHEVEAERHAEGEHEEHAEHDEHGDEHAHEDSDMGETHSEFHANYHFDCNNTAIEAIGLSLFETWPRIEEVRVQALTPRGQTGGNIDANNPVIRLQ